MVTTRLAEDLLELAIAGDESARDELLGSQRAALYSYVKSRVRSREDAEDIVQLTLSRASVNLAQFQGGCKFSAWLFRIAANAIITHYHRVLSRTSGQISLDTSFDGAEPSVHPVVPVRSLEDRVSTDEYARRLLAAAKEVCNESEYRVIVMMSQGDTSEEVGELLAMNRATVKSHYLRGRRKLIAYLFEHEPTLLGGEEEIAGAVCRACQSADPKAKLTEPELRAFEEREPREAFRDACVKIARHLPIAVILLEVCPWSR